MLINGNIITMKTSKPRAQAAAILNSRIVEVGSNAEVKRLIGKNTKTIDLRGKTVVPGFIDTHAHMASLGHSLTWIDLRGINSIKEMQKKLQDRVRETPKGKWILGRGWDQDRFKERRYPTRWDLDTVSPFNPVVFNRVCGHICVANSKALELANITKETLTPPSGQIDKNPKTSEPTGILREAANDLVWNTVPESSEEELAQVCGLACKKAVEAGLTSVHWFVYKPVEIRALQTLREQGRLPLRVYIVIPIEFLSCLQDAGVSTGLGDHMLKLGGVKILADGSLGARTAALNKPYNDEPSTKGILCWGRKELEETIVKAQDAGFQVCVHAIGDRAINETLSAFEKVLKKKPRKDFRHRLEHASVLNKQLIRRLRRLGLIACVQPHFVISDFWVESRLGAARARWTYPFKTLIENGVLLAGGSDCPVEPVSPLLGVYALVARESFPEERVSVEEALRVYTVNAAFASFEEDVKGSIEVGKLADFAVLSHDPFVVKPEKIRDITVEMTIVGGKIVYSKVKKRRQAY